MKNKESIGKKALRSRNTVNTGIFSSWVRTTFGIAMLIEAALTVGCKPKEKPITPPVSTSNTPILTPPLSSTSDADPSDVESQVEEYEYKTDAGTWKCKRTHSKISFMSNSGSLVIQGKNESDEKTCTLVTGVPQITQGCIEALNKALYAKNDQETKRILAEEVTQACRTGK